MLGLGRLGCNEYTDISLNPDLPKINNYIVLRFTFRCPSSPVHKPLIPMRPLPSQICRKILFNICCEIDWKSGCFLNWKLYKRHCGIIRGTNIHTMTANVDCSHTAYRCLSSIARPLILYDRHQCKPYYIIWISTNFSIPFMLFPAFKYQRFIIKICSVQSRNF